MKKSVIWFVGAILVVLFQNCAQDVAFKTEDAASLASTSRDPGSDAAGTPSSQITGKEGFEQFKVVFNSVSAPLDMIWVIDNSGSMSTEAALVRKNFDAFLTVLNKNTNFRLLLISAQGTSGTAVSIPSGFDPNTHLQINQSVGSTNGTVLAVDKLSALPAGFLRQDSKKIFVFVTDDNSQIGANNFLSTLMTQQNWPAKDVSVSSFIGIDAQTSPCMAREGAVYKELATQTSGYVYNICAEDWSAHFNDLISSSVSKAVRRFTLSAATVTSIVEVKVDGVVLAKESYSLSGKTLTLVDGVVLGENSTVSVTYL